MELNSNQTTDKHNLHCQLCLQLIGINQLEAEQKKWFISSRRFSLEVGCDKIWELVANTE
jgi:hypothetical protein